MHTSSPESRISICEQDAALSIVKAMRLAMPTTTDHPVSYM